MGKPKKQKKGKHAARVVFSAQEQSLAASILAQLDGRDPARLIERIPDAGTARALAEMAPGDSPAVIPLLESLQREFPEKAVQKAVKRAIFKLRSRGMRVSLPDDGTASPHPIRPQEGEAPIAALSAIDGAGNRAVFMALPRMPVGFVVGMGIVNDERGMVRFQVGSYGKKRMREVRAAFGERLEAMVPVSPAHAATVLERAHALTMATAANPPPGYLEIRPLMLEGVDLLKRAPAFDLVPEDRVPPGPLTDGQLDALFGHRLFASWVIAPDDLEPLLGSFDKLADSPILLSGAQRLERETEAKNDWLAEHYPESRRLLLKERLEEMACVLHLLDDEQTARLALAAAADLGRPVPSLRPDSVPAYLLDRTLRLYEKLRRGADGEKDRPKTPSSRILIP